MGRGPATFKLSDLTRALMAARKAGLDASRIRIAPTGEIVIDIGRPSIQPDQSGDEVVL
jgi:hypothetical protein